MTKKLLFMFIIAAGVASLSGCAIFINLFNSDPEVSLTASARFYGSATDFYWGEWIIFTATATDDDDEDILTYSWKYDNVTDSSLTASSIYAWPQDVGTHTYSVTVDDGYGGTASASVSFNVYQGAVVRIQNITNAPVLAIDEVYVAPSYWGYWGPDHLSSILGNLDYVDVKTPRGNTDFRAVAGLTHWEYYVQATPNATTYQFDLGNLGGAGLDPTPNVVGSRPAPTAADRTVTGFAVNNMK